MTYNDLLVMLDICNRPNRTERLELVDIVWENSDHLSYRQLNKLLGILGEV